MQQRRFDRIYLFQQLDNHSSGLKIENMNKVVKNNILIVEWEWNRWRMKYFYHLVKTNLV